MTYFAKDATPLRDQLTNGRKGGLAQTARFAVMREEEELLS